MHVKHLYEYAVIRVLPKVERDEFVNVGIILFSKKADYINLIYHLDENRLTSFSKDIDLEQVSQILDSYVKISSGSKDGGVIARLDTAERFRWLTAVKSSCVQTSRPHPGFSTDLDKTMQHLLTDLVL